MKKIVFLSGLPRTGSTVLSSMLNQHPGIYATTTSPVADLIMIIIEKWKTISGALINPDKNQFGNILTSVIGGAYKHIEKDIVIDKNRLWPKFSSDLYKATGVKPKIICTVRDIPEIMASYILLIEKNKNVPNFIDESVKNNNLPINNKNRCKLLLDKIINHSYTSLTIGFNSNSCDILFIEYNDIVNSGQKTVDKICDFLDCNKFILDTNNLQPMDENDSFYGNLQGLHEVRKQLLKISPEPEQVLGCELTQIYRNMRLEFWRK